MRDLRGEPFQPDPRPAVHRTARHQPGTVDAPWKGPTTGPQARHGKNIVFIAQTLTNPGVAGVAQSVQESAKLIGWKARTLNGQGTPTGVRSAFQRP